MAHYLKTRGFRVLTLDIDRHLAPDVVGSVHAIPFADSAFDLVACFEVLEHLPYEEVTGSALKELFRVSRRWVVISVPDRSRVWPFSFHIPKIGDKRVLLPVPRMHRLAPRTGGQHYWEIGESNCSLRRFAKDLAAAGFVIWGTYRVFEMPYHRFFVMEESEAGS